MSGVTKDSPFFRRFYAYLQERFPLLNHGLLIISYYSSNQFLAQTLYSPAEKMHYSLRSLAGAVVLLCLFFHLRVFDEHKDYEDDCLYHPQRILQKGLVSLNNLKVLGIIAISLELVITYILGLAAFTALLIALGFSLLMLKEFFVRSWLRKHFLLYATTHMLIMPLLAMVIFSITVGRYFWEIPELYWLYAFVGFFVTYNWEISRKIRAPEEEREGVDSYTKQFGLYGAGYIVLLIRMIDTAMVAVVGYKLQLTGWFYVVLIALYFICLIGFLDYRVNTTAKSAKRMELYAGMYIIAFDIILAVSIAVKRGIQLN